MSGSVNRVTLIGNLTRDPEIRSTQDGQKVANVSIATSESWKDKSTGERKSKAEYHRVVIFNEPLVRIVEAYCVKGSKVYISGSLQTRKWTDNAGAEKYSTEIVLQKYGGEIVLLDPKRGESSSGDTGGKSAATLDDDLVF